MQQNATTGNQVLTSKPMENLSPLKILKAIQSKALFNHKIPGNASPSLIKQASGFVAINFMNNFQFRKFFLASVEC